MIILVKINSNHKCWSNENTYTIDKNDAIRLKFSSKIPYKQENCSIHIINPLLSNRQNGFGVFLSESMDCTSMVTIDCLPGSVLINQVRLSFL